MGNNTTRLPIEKHTRDMRLYEHKRAQETYDQLINRILDYYEKHNESARQTPDV